MARTNRSPKKHLPEENYAMFIPPKCPRCWNHNDAIGTAVHHAELCDRCAAVVG